jgi:exopolysaccharide production protein ExoY
LSGYPDSQSLLPQVVVRPKRSFYGTRTLPGDLPGIPGWLVLMERSAAFVGLILLMPVLTVTAAAIFVLSGRSPLIAHARLGRYGNPIWMLKLRTMWQGSGRRWRLRSLFTVERIDGAWVPRSKRQADTRVTSGFAALCRRHSIDELPQLWHVLSGEMSLVGPRPITALEFDLWYGRDAADILLRRPGLTGLWQVKGRSALSYSQRRRLDLFLVRKWSLWLYLKVLLSTVPRVISGEDAV